MNGPKERRQADFGGNKSVQLLEMKIKFSKISKQLNSGENMNEERISKLGARTEALVLNVSQKYKEMTERLGGMEEEGGRDIEFQKE